MNHFIKFGEDDDGKVESPKMGCYIKICEEDDDEVIELPSEDDNTLLLSTLCAQFPGATGLKYKSDHVFRGVRLVDGKFYAPEGYWGKNIYNCVFPKENKRKCDDSLFTSNVKTKRFEKNVCSDLIVLGLPWKMDDSELRDYFEAFGELVMAVVKRDMQNGNSKGFGFIRFENYASQLKALSKRHLIDGRWCDVKIPNSKEGPNQRVPCKIFVGRVPESITVENLHEYFTQFGKVTDVYIPKPFRFFAFVTFESPDIAQSLCGQDHIIRGASVHISEASPRGENTPRIDNAKSQKNDENKSGDNTAALLSALGVNPAVVAALNQAGWNLLSNNPGNNGISGSGPGNTSLGGIPPFFSNPGMGFRPHHNSPGNYNAPNHQPPTLPPSSFDKWSHPDWHRR